MDTDHAPLRSPRSAPHRSLAPYYYTSRSVKPLRRAALSRELRDGDLGVVRAIGVGRLDHVLGAKDGDLELGLLEALGEALEGLAVGADDLIAGALAHLGGDTRQVVDEGAVALLIGGERRVEVARRADDGLLEGGVVELEALEHPDRAAIDVERALQVGVA